MNEDKHVVFRSCAACIEVLCAPKIDFIWAVKRFVFVLDMSFMLWRS